MISGVLALNERDVHTIMTPRNDILGQYQR